MSTLRQIHDDIDRAVAEAYGWPAALSDSAIIDRLVALNLERAREESSGLIRWLRPELQLSNQDDLLLRTKPSKNISAPTGKRRSRAKLLWPRDRPSQVATISSALAASGQPLTPEDLAELYARPQRKAIEEILAALITLGRVRQSPDKCRYSLIS